MKEINTKLLNEYSEEFNKTLKKLASEITCEKSYPASILNRTQSGRIFVDDIHNTNAAIFYHYCGIAYVTGETNDKDFINTLLSLLNGKYEEDQRRFYLIVSKNQKNWIDILNNFCDENPEINKAERYYFNFNLEKYKKLNLSMKKCFNFFEIKPHHLVNLTGRVIPSFSWDNESNFFKYGKGFGVYDNQNNKIASTSFSSGIGAGFIDIGIETQIEYRNQGFATLSAYKMIEYILQRNCTPEWGCDASNLGSAATAESVGFEKSSTYNIYYLK